MRCCFVCKTFQVMGPVICLWRREWKKNREHEWHFFLDQTDFGFRVIVDENESFQTLKDLSIYNMWFLDNILISFYMKIAKRIFEKLMF